MCVVCVHVCVLPICCLHVPMLDEQAISCVCECVSVCVAYQLLIIKCTCMYTHEASITKT